MHKYLESVGFKRIESKKQEEMLIGSIIQKPKRKKIITNQSEYDMMYAELSIEYAPGVGIKVLGQYDAEENFHMEHYFPYIEGRSESLREPCVIAKRMEATAFSGMCDDGRLGVSLIFYITNVVDCIKETGIDPDPDEVEKKVRLAGLCTEGMVILPTIYSADVLTNGEKKLQHVKRAADGRENEADEAERMAIEQFDLLNSINGRIGNEDVFSIVETSLLPYGMEAEVYKILGIIESVQNYENPVFGERLYVMTILCNDIVLDICINEDSIVGKPMPGFRFRGIVWLQGKVE